MTALLLLLGTVLWDPLLTRVAGQKLARAPATLSGFRVVGAEAIARFDWYEAAFDCLSESLPLVGLERPGGGAGLVRDRVGP